MRLALHLDGRSIRGAERQALLVARGLRNRGHDVVVSCRLGGPVETAAREAGLRTTAVRPRGNLDPVSAVRFAAWLRRERTDAVLLSSWKRVAITGWAARVAGTRRVVLRMGSTHTTGTGIAGVARRFALRRYYDAIVANSQAVREAILADLPDYPLDAVHVIPNSVDLPRMPPAPIRRELGIPEEAILLLAVGDLDARKGYDVLARAVGRLDDRVHVAIAGGGDRSRRCSVERELESAGLGGRAHLLGRRQDIPALLGAADVFVHASRVEGFPTAVLEAMAAGVPVVATRVGGVDRALGPHDGHPVAGWPVPIDDPTALAAALADVVAGVRSDEREVRARVEEASRRIGTEFGLDRMIEAYEAVLG